MPPRFDSERRVLEIAVADLLDPVLARSIGFAHRGGFERLWLGQAIHGRYQESALAEDPGYRREVALRLELEHRGWRVVVTGRADGVRRDEAGLVVEEIKSVRRQGQLAPAVRQVYERQALLYAWMLERLEQTPVRAELVLIAIGSDAVERLEIEADPADLELAARRRLNQLLAEHERAKSERADRRRAGVDLPFPHAELRTGQEAIVAAVERALEEGEHLLLEAPTGLGKTAAALWPAVRHALEHDRRLFVLTAKNLQQEMATRVLRQLAAGTGLHALRLRAKARMCANGEVICHEDYCAFARDYYPKLAASRLVPALLGETEVLEPDLIFSAAAGAEVCPFEVSLDLAGRSQVVVCDYNYAFDPFVALADFAADADLADTVLVIDEIHNLVDRGRSYLSPELSAALATRAARAAEAAGSTPVLRRLAEVAAELARLVEREVDGALDALPGSDAAAEVLLPEDALWRLRPDFDAAFVDYLEHQRETRSFRAEDEFVELYFRLLRFLDGLGARGPAFSHLVERRGQDRLLRVLCKDPSGYLAGVLSRVHACVGLSATLSPSEFYRDLLGFDPARTTTLSLPSPFPAENRCLVVDRSVSTLYRERPANARPIGERIAAFADAVPGNCLVLFPSFAFLTEVSAHVAPARKRVFVQQRTDTERDREALLEVLRGAVLGDVLLLAVAGGVFAEGVDYPGDVLRAVAVVGPCLPVPTLDQRLLQEYYEERFERGFEYAFVVPGMTRVVQAAGRLIRSAEDSGVIALFDRRFLDRPYRDRLPADWLSGAGGDTLSGDPAAAARVFFAELAARVR